MADNYRQAIQRASNTIEVPFTGTGNIVAGTHKCAPGVAWKLEEIELTLNAAPTTGTQNFVISKDDSGGTAYDNTILTIDLVANAVTSLIIKPDKNLKSGDVVTATWTNTDGKTFGLIFKYTKR